MAAETSAGKMNWDMIPYTGDKATASYEGERLFTKGNNTLRLRPLGKWAETISADAEQNEQNNFVPFSNDPAYREANRKLIEKSFGKYAPDEGFIHLDVGGGTGLMVQEGIGIAQNKGKKGRFIMVEPDEFAIVQAFNSTPSVDGISVNFVQGVGQEVEQILDREIGPDGMVDSASVLDAIHEIRGIDNKRSTTRGIVNRLKPGGILIENSAFTTIAQQDPRYGRWKFGAIHRSGGKRVKARKEEVKLETAEQVEIKKTLDFQDSDSSKTAILPPKFYVDLLTLPEEEGGFGMEVILKEEETVQMSESALEGITTYPRFSEGFFEDVEFEEGTVVTIGDKIRWAKEAIKDIPAKDGVIALPRDWYNIIVQKPIGAPMPQAA